MAGVKVWYDWANLLENQFYHSVDRAGFIPRIGDIVLFDRLLENVELDHIGIVVGIEQEGIVTAEGNVVNQTGVFSRPFNKQINSYVRLNRF